MDWLHAYDTTLYFLPQDPSALFSNAWLCGGSAEGDDGSVRTTISSRYRLPISFELEWSQPQKQTKIDTRPTLEQIGAQVRLPKVSAGRRSCTCSVAGNAHVVAYFDAFPRAKAADWRRRDWRCIYDMILHKAHLTNAGFAEIARIKAGMNRKR